MADASGNIYCSVGNGTFDANKGGTDYGMCYLKTHAQPERQHTDSGELVRAL